jgi:hypothetical protein
MKFSRGRSNTSHTLIIVYLLFQVTLMLYFFVACSWISWLQSIPRIYFTSCINRFPDPR